MSEKKVIIIDEIQKIADQGEFEKAVSLCEEYLNENKTEFNGYYLLANIYSALKLNDLSEKNYLKALYLNPEHSESAHQLYYIYLQKGDMRKAEMYKEMSRKYS